MRQRRPCSTCEGRGHAKGNPFEACDLCMGTGTLEQKCNACGRWKPVAAFIGPLKNGKAKVKANCTECGRQYAEWGKLSKAEQEELKESRKGLDPKGPLRVFFTLESENRKTGKIPVSMTSASSCPPSCGYYGAGCYAERHVLGMHWRRLSRGQGRTWSVFCDMVRRLPSNQLWRHNEAGDLPGIGETLAESEIVELAGASSHTRGFTYTHKLGKALPMVARERHFELLRYLNRSGVTVNLSIDKFEELDLYTQYGLPLTTVLPDDAPRIVHTKGGIKVMVCPAQTNEGTTCQSCGICQAKDRKAAVGFLAHGNAAAQITDRLTPRRQLPLFQEVSHAR